MKRSLIALLNLTSHIDDEFPHEVPYEIALFSQHLELR